MYYSKLKIQMDIMIRLQLHFPFSVMGDCVLTVRLNKLGYALYRVALRLPLFSVLTSTSSDMHSI